MSVARVAQHGAPCWIDVVQPDMSRGREFYGEVFGWTFADPHERSDGIYQIAMLDGRPVAGLAMRSGEPEWRTYLAVDDIDAATSSALASGATISTPVTMQPEGRSAAVVDPFGAHFGLLESSTRREPRMRGLGSWRWATLRTLAPCTVIDWYSAQFGWVERTTPSVTALFLAGQGEGGVDDEPPGAVLPDTHKSLMHAAAWVTTAIEPTHWLPVFRVADRAGSIDRIERLGGTLLSKHDIAGRSEGAVMQDPQGAQFAIARAGA
ncbi:VOC family protein [Demetria terragena]|uniref:VOC family protein n=1 Tax=Demetria terragena TaxID=63959 RepID=UPI0003633F26|nr:VOC family protein [Demetria terragena]